MCGGSGWLGCGRGGDLWGLWVGVSACGRGQGGWDEREKLKHCAQASAR